MGSHAEITFVVSWIPSNTLLANFFYFLNEEFKNHSMFVSLTMRDVHHSWLSFVCNIPAWSVEAFTRIIAKAGLWGLRQAYIDDINVYNDPDEGEEEGAEREEEGAEREEEGAEREGVEREDITQLQPYGCPLPLTDDEFPKKFDCIDERYNQDLVEDIEVILMTATQTELRAVMGYLKPKDGRNKIVLTFYGKKSLYVGKYGDYPVVVGMSAPGPSEQGPISAIHHLYNIKSAIPQMKYIIAVGICYGMYHNNKNPADIIVANEVCDATCIRVGAHPHTRSSGYKVESDLLSVFDSTINLNFEMIRDKAGNKVEAKVGPIISRPDLVDDAKYKEQLISACNRPDALGGEMEGAGIMSFAHHHKNVEAIIIKAIGDWGDGNKKKMKVWKGFAAHAAAGYVHFVMKRGIL